MALKTRLADVDTNVETSVRQKLEPWLLNPPDMFDMIEAYEVLGKLKASYIRKKREIEREENKIAASIEKPRSNSAKVAKLQATETLRDQLAEIEAHLAVAEIKVKQLEYQRSMFNAATYNARSIMDG